MSIIVSGCELNNSLIGQTQHARVHDIPLDIPTHDATFGVRTYYDFVNMTCFRFWVDSSNFPRRFFRTLVLVKTTEANGIGARVGFWLKFLRNGGFRRRKPVGPPEFQVAYKPIINSIISCRRWVKTVLPKILGKPFGR